MVTLRLLDTFSGIGGFSLAAMWLGGFETVQFVEVDPFCRRVLKKHWPDVPIHHDICNFRPKRGFADVIVSGFPCQDISTAGKQRGIKEGTRSGLFYELMRVVSSVRPRYIVLENVAAITRAGGVSVLLLERWPKQGMMRNGLALKQAMLERFANGTASGRLPTPSATEANGTCSKRFPGSPHYKGSRVSEALRTCESDPLLAHPVFCEELMGFPTNWTDCEQSEMQWSLMSL
jgi:DNA (cytosine-5)-methyltransferase 1